MSDLWLGTYWLKIAAGYEFGTIKLADVFDLWLVTLLSEVFEIVFCKVKLADVFDLWLVTLLFEVFEIVFGKVKLTDVFDRWLMTVYTRTPTSQAKPSIV